MYRGSKESPNFTGREAERVRFDSLERQRRELLQILDENDGPRVEAVVDGKVVAAVQRTGSSGVRLQFVRPSEAAIPSVFSVALDPELPAYRAADPNTAVSYGEDNVDNPRTGTSLGSTFQFLMGPRLMEPAIAVLKTAPLRNAPSKRT